MAQQNRKFKDCKWWNLSKLVTNTLGSLILVIFELRNPPLFLLGEKQIFRKRCSGEMVKFSLPGGEFCLGACLGESFA